MYGSVKRKFTKSVKFIVNKTKGDTVDNTFMQVYETVDNTFMQAYDTVDIT